MIKKTFIKYMDSTHNVIWDVISLSVIPIFLFPYGMAIIKKDVSYAVIAVGTIVCEIIVKLTRRLPVVHPVQLRPSGAKNCSILNRGGSYEGRIGMPSGHVMLTSYVLVSLYMISEPEDKLYYGIAMIIGITLMSMSRVIRVCHNIPQVVIGATLGAVFAYISVNHIIPKVKWIKDKSETSSDDKEI